MPLFNPSLKLQRFAANTKGRDFVVGDTHGCLEDLLVMLKLISFDEENDRLFSVGDLIDRGPNSRETAELIYKPWFFSIRGNHEQMMIDALLRNDRNSQNTWLGNGGMWYLSEDKTAMLDLAKDFDTLPLVIVVGEGEDRFNVVHAELIHMKQVDHHRVRVKVTDKMIDRWVFDEEEEFGMVWGRTIISNGHPTFPPPEHQLWHDLEEMSMTYVGHTPVRDTVIVQRQMYIDNGAVFHRYGHGTSETNRLVIACPKEKVVYSYTLLNSTMRVIPYEEIQVLA